MANECKVFQQQSPRSRNAPIRVVPWKDYDTLSDNDVITLGLGTTMITVISSVAGTLDFEPVAGTTPDGTLNPFSIAASTLYDFDVKPGMKMRFDT